MQRQCPASLASYHCQLDLLMQLGAIATALDIGLNDRCSAYHQRPAKNVSQRAGLGHWIRSLGEVMRQNVSRDSLSETKMPCEAPPKSKPGDELQSLLSDWVDRVSRWTSSLSSSDNQLLPLYPSASHLHTYKHHQGNHLKC